MCNDVVIFWISPNSGILWVMTVMTRITNWHDLVHDPLLIDPEPCLPVIGLSGAFIDWINVEFVRLYGDCVHHKVQNNF